MTTIEISTDEKRRLPLSISVLIFVMIFCGILILIKGFIPPTASPLYKSAVVDSHTSAIFGHIMASVGITTIFFFIPAYFLIKLRKRALYWSLVSSFICIIYFVNGSFNLYNQLIKLKLSSYNLLVTLNYICFLLIPILTFIVWVNNRKLFVTSNK